MTDDRFDELGSKPPKPVPIDRTEIVPGVWRYSIESTVKCFGKVSSRTVAELQEELDMERRTLKYLQREYEAMRDRAEAAEARLRSLKA